MTGSWRCTLDVKGRIAVPSKLRGELGERFHVTRGAEGCLTAYSDQAWQEMSAKIKTYPSAKQRVLRRMLFANATTCEPDGQGRILLSKELRDYAGLDKDVTFLGVDEYAEIWDTAKWEQFNGSMTAEDLAAALDED